jgi:hypothetical protein
MCIPRHFGEKIMTIKTFKGLPQSGLTRKLKARDKARRLERGALASISGAGEKRRNDRLPHLEIVSHQLADLKSPVRALRKLDPVHIREIDRRAWLLRTHTHQQRSFHH